MIDLWLALKYLSMPRKMIDMQDTDNSLHFKITNAEKHPS